MEDIKTILSSIEKHKELLEDIKTGIYFWSVETNLFFPSKYLLDMLGLTYEEAFGDYMTWRKIWHPDDEKMIDDIRLKAILNHETEYHLLHRLKHKDGQYRWFKTNAMIIYDNGVPKTIIGSTNNFEKLQSRLEDLEIEQATYKNYLEATEAATWIWNIKTHETVFDDRWAALLGYKLEELGKTTIETWAKLTHPDDLVIANQALDYAFLNKAPYQVEFRMRHKDGHYVWISDRGIVVSYEDNQPLIMIGTHIDITKKKQLEAELRANEYKYKQLVESSYDVIYLLDQDANIEFVSKAWERLTGYQVFEVVGHTFSRFIYKDDLDLLKSFFETLKENPDRHELASYRIKHKDGSIRYFTTNAIAIRDESGNLTGVAGTATDITDERLLKQKLSYEKDLFKKTLLSVTDGVISVDRDGIITLINPSALNLTGFKEAEAIGKPLEQILRFEGSGKTAYQKNIKRIFEKEAYIRRKSGKIIPIESNFSPILDSDGKQDGKVIVFRDISDQLKQAKDIEFLSYHDYLTGLYNRRYMENAMRNYDQRTFLPLGLMMLDVNDLKEMNDGFGHQAGDKLLQVVSGMILNLIDKDDLLGRIGGDEFMILLPNTTKERMQQLKNKLMAAFKSETIYNQPINVAIGCGIKERSHESIHDVLKHADDLMYEHKVTLR